MRNLALTVLLLFGALPVLLGQTANNRDDTLTGWGNCGLSCAGGTGNGTGTQTINNASPSLDGASMQLSVTGPALSGGQTTNYLWYWHAGANNSATTFSSTWHVYIPSTALIQENEFDTHQFAGGHRWFWGSQCAPGGVWAIWNELAQTWVNTSVSCTLTAATWHTIVWQVHRIPGDTSCASSQPCDYYDRLFVDNVDVTPVGGFTPQPSGPTTFGDDTGNDTQIDLNSTGGTASEFIDELQFTASIPANQDNLYCPYGTPTWGTADGPASLPTACYNTLLANTPATGSVVSVSTAGQLTTALAAAACGQQITLQAGASFSGNFTVPALSCPSNNYLWIVTSGLASLPPEGSRYNTLVNGNLVYAPQFGPAYAGVTSLPGRPALAYPRTAGTYTAQLKTPNNSPVLTFTTGTSGVRVIGIEFARTAGTGKVSPLIQVGGIGNINHVIFDRTWMHGDENQDETETAFSVHDVSYIALIDSYTNNFYCISVSGACSDSHVVFGGCNATSGTTETGSKIVNSFVEAAGENIFFGGCASNTTPSNIEIRLNLLFKPNTWNPSDASYNGGVGGNPVIVKNAIEFKNAQLALIEGNQVQNVWAQAQEGYAFLLNPTPQGALCPTCFVKNVTYRYDTINNACAFMQITAAGSNGGAQLAAAAGNWSIHDLVGDNLFNSSLFQCQTSTASVILTEADAPLNSQALKNVSFSHNTIVYAAGSGTPVTLFGLRGATVASGNQISNMTVTNNLAWTGTRGTSNQGGTACAFGLTGPVAQINNCWSPYKFGGNCFVNNGTVAWPGTNVTSVASFSSAFVSYNAGNAGNYTVAFGACKGAGNDGLDPGANIAQVASVLAGNAPVPATSLFNAGWNHIAVPAPPPVWPPTDSNANLALLRSWRVHDSGQKLGQIAPTSPGTINWASGGGRQLDSIVNTLAASGSLPASMTVLYTFSDTPTWAALGTDPNCASPGTSSCVPFNDMDANSATCNATPNSVGTQNAIVLANCGNGVNTQDMYMMYQIISRFAGLGMGYECWNEPDGAGNFWSNAAAYGGLGHAPTRANQPPLTRLVRHCADLTQMVHQLDPTAKVYTPSVHGPAWSSWWPLFAATSVNQPACTGACSAAIGGATWPAATVTGAQIAWDVTNGHLRGQGNNADPTQFLPMYADMLAAQAIPSNGLPAAACDDEWGPVGTSQFVNLNTTAGYVAIGLLLRASVGLPCQYYYQWDNGTFILQGTTAGLAWDVVAQKWLTGSVVNPSTVSGTVYSVTGTHPTLGNFKAMFDSSQTCSTSSCTTLPQSGAGFSNYMDVGGVTHPISLGTVPVGFQPIFLTNTGLPSAATPVCSPASGTFSANQNVTCSTSSGGAVQCYNFTGAPSTNGSTGCAGGSTLYAGPIALTVNQAALYIVAGGTGYSDSPVGTFGSYTFQGTAPTQSPNGGTFTNCATDTLSQAQSLSMCYTTDGSAPTSNGTGTCSHGTLYSVPVSVCGNNEVVSAIGMKNGWTDSNIGAATFFINFTLTQTVVGLGTVSSSPIGINNCSSGGGTCSALFSSGSVITLTATPGSMYSFASWGGAGAGCGGTPTCAVTMSAAEAVTATFTTAPPIPTVSVQGFVF